MGEFVAGGDIFWFLTKTDATPRTVDAAELHLRFAETAAKYRRLTNHVPVKLAALQTCIDYNVAVNVGCHGYDPEAVRAIAADRAIDDVLKNEEGRRHEVKLRHLDMGENAYWGRTSVVESADSRASASETVPLDRSAVRTASSDASGALLEIQSLIPLELRNLDDGILERMNWRPF
jgi:hypothetical protein